MMELFDFLYENDIEVYFVGQKKGECTSNYAVVRDAGTLGEGNNKIGSQLIDIILFSKQVTDLISFKNKIKELMKGFKTVRYIGEETPIIPESDFKAFSCSIVYQNQKIL